MDAPAPISVQTSPPLRPEVRWLDRAGSHLIQGAAFVWKYFFGMVLCQTLVGGVLVVGWTYRLMQRSMLKSWWRQSRAREQGVTFEQFVEGSHLTTGQADWPNWITGQNAWGEIRRRASEGAWSQLRTAFRVAAHSLWRNLKLGVQAIFNTWVLTLPACVLWLFAWYDGWNNSFTKGYEQATVGPLTGVLGVILFIGAMLYLPMAQARQAATGHWRSFYQFKLVWGLVRRQWLGCLALAILYTAFSVPVMILKTMPEFFPQINPALASVTDERALEILRQYFFWCAAVVVPAYVMLRLVAARVYSSALLSAVRKGGVSEESLAEVEWEALHRLELLELNAPRPKPAFMRAVAWAGTRAGRVTATILLVFVWFTFVAQIFVSEFFNYHPKVGWLNQPLVQLPWFNYIPPRSK